MTPVFFFFFPEGATIFFLQKVLILAYVNQTVSIKQKQRPTTRGTDQVSSPFTIKNGVLYTPISRLSFGRC